MTVRERIAALRWMEHCRRFPALADQSAVQIVWKSTDAYQTVCVDDTPPHEEKGAKK